MDTNLNEAMPIYIQIINKIKASIISGELKAGEKVQSVRELAKTFSVNPNTMQRALSELEREGLLESDRTAGRFVTKNNDKIEDMRQEAAKKIVENCLREMKNLGFSRREIDRFFQGAEIDENTDLKGAV